MARSLLRNYESFLRSTADIALDGFERELEDLAQRWGEPTATMLLAMVDGVAGGCVAVQRLPYRENAVEMKRMWVEPLARGHGVGRGLAEAAIGWARAHGAGELLLDTVAAAMPEANRLYDALGFKPTSRYNENPVQNVIFFRLALR